MDACERYFSDEADQWERDAREEYMLEQYEQQLGEYWDDYYRSIQI